MYLGVVAYAYVHVYYVLEYPVFNINIALLLLQFIDYIMVEPLEE